MYVVSSRVGEALFSKFMMVITLIVVTITKMSNTDCQYTPTLTIVCNFVLALLSLSSLLYITAIIIMVSYKNID